MEIGGHLPDRAASSVTTLEEEGDFSDHQVVVSDPGVHLGDLSHLLRINIRRVLDNLHVVTVTRGPLANMVDAIVAHLAAGTGSFHRAALLLSLIRIPEADQGTLQHKLIVSGVEEIMKARIAGFTIIIMVTRVQNAG